MTIGTVFEYRIYALDNFTFLSKKTSSKEWNFEIKIKKIKENLFELSYSKELLFCFNQLYDLIKLEIKEYSNTLTFLYEIRENNLIKVVDKTQIIKYLKYLQTVKKKNPELKDKFEFVDIYLKNKDLLDNSLLAEVQLIHEFEGRKFKIGNSIVTDKESMSINDFNKIKRLKKDETEFLTQIKWDTVRILNLIKISKLDKTNYFLDLLIGTNTLSSKEVTDLEFVSRCFFDDKFEIDNFEHITLVRDRRILSKNGYLTFLSKERRTVSDMMKKITKIEITKKQQPT